MLANAGKIIVGTSGYSFDDWAGVFYPPDLPKGKRLDFYKEHFNVTEINSTYYRIPHPAVFYNIAKKVGDNFEFMIKTHRSFTHDRRDLKKQCQLFNDSIRPMTDSGKLKGLMAQFPFSIKFTKANLDYIINGKDFFPGHNLFVEFRHDSWDIPEVYDSLAKNDIGVCSVDEPQLPGLFPPKPIATTNIGYVRLHGRNSANWWGGEGDRYDYMYSENELKEWKDKIDLLKKNTDKLYLFFNNCHLGQAVRNAKMFLDMIQTEMTQ